MINIREKVIRVINSCRRKEQLEVASKYTNLAIKKFPDEDFSEISRIFQQKKDEIERLSVN